MYLAVGNNALQVFVDENCSYSHNSKYDMNKFDQSH